MNILVADDSMTGLAILTAALNKLGHSVISATSGEQAIDLFTRMRPDFVILDVVMPNMSGFECAKKLRDMNNEDWIPIIFLSASIDDDSISQGIDAGGDDYLTKPFSEMMLAAKIKAMQRIADMQKKLSETTRQLSILSATDELTGINNRGNFDKVIKEQITFANRYHTKLALLFLDLDHFKEVNDQFGHQMGDLLLKEVANRLKACLRETDFIARLGGDEFAVILNKIDQRKEADSVAKKILGVLSPTYYLGNHEIHISCSIGISCYPISGKTPEVLVQRADQAMYDVKASGRNSFKHYSAQMNKEKDPI